MNVICRLCLGDTSWRRFSCRQRCDVGPGARVRVRVCVVPLPWLEGGICSTVLHAPAIVDSVMTSDLVRVCVFGSALCHCRGWGGGDICFTVSHAPVVPSDTAGLCDIGAILIQGRYYSLSKTNLCLYVIK